VAYLTQKYKVDAGVVISASHNPVEFNGIKFFDGNGYKLPDALEDEIEALIKSNMEGIQFPTGSGVGKIKYRTDAREEYINHSIRSVNVDLSGLKIVVDCAEGASYYTSVEALKELGANVVAIHNNPDGTNINANCGSTHMEELCARVVYEKANLGLAFDGDADRMLAVDENGKLVDGDQIMSIIGNYMKERGSLKQNTIVVTVMSNLGMTLMAKENGINLEMQRRANCCGRLSHIIGRFKSAVTRFARENGIPFAWQPRFHDRIVRNQNEMNRIAEYIEQNPAKWETDCYNE
jgi:phosphoglucosamine mutase